MDQPTMALAGDGWYGKIPAAGDFVHRRVSRDWIAWWDRWLQHGLAAMRHLPADAQRHFATAPAWNFAIPAGSGAGAVRLGCIAPSRDRVGRHYPLSAIHSIALDEFEPFMLEAASDYYRAAGTALLASIKHGCDADVLDEALLRAGAHALHRPVRSTGGGSDIMDILNGNGAPASSTPEAAWCDLSLTFSASSHASYWWTNHADGAALETYVHSGALNATLFSRLFLSRVGARR